MRINNAIYASKSRRKKRKKKELTPFRELKRWEIIVLGYRRELRISHVYNLERAVSKCSVLFTYSRL